MNSHATTKLIHITIILSSHEMLYNIAFCPVLSCFSLEQEGWAVKKDLFFIPSLYVTGSSMNNKLSLASSTLDYTQCVIMRNSG